MKIVLTSDGQSEDAEVDERFGRCQFFAIFDTEDSTLTYHKNEGQASSQGAGIASSQFIADQGANVLITGRVGPKALQGLEGANIKMFKGDGMTLSAAIDAYKQGLLRDLR